MMNQMKMMLLLLLVSLGIQMNITINEINYPKCVNSIIKFSSFGINGKSDEKLKENLIFVLYLTGSKTKYTAFCYFLGNQEPIDMAKENEDNKFTNNTEPSMVLGTETVIDLNSDFMISYTDLNTENTNLITSHTDLITSYSDSISKNTRILENDENQNLAIINLNGGCLIMDNIPNQEEIGINNNTSLIKSSENITFKDNFLNITLKECTANLSDYESDLNISFSQINNFKYLRDKKVVLFYFYGYTFNNILKDEYIFIYVNLVINGSKKENTDIALCLAIESVITNGDKKKIGFDCEIKFITEDVDSLVFHSSKYISGIPKDETLLRPNGTMSQASDTEEIPTFKITSINYTTCAIDGNFIIIGDLDVEFKEDLSFTLQFSYPEKITANCNIKQSNKKNNVEISCKTNEKFDGEVNVKIAQQSIYDNNKIEKLLFKRYVSNDKFYCNIGMQQNEIIKKEYNIFILQVQLINNSLYIFSMIDFPITNETFFTVNITIITSKNLRNLQQSNEVIEVHSSENYDGTLDKIITLSSDEKLEKNISSIQVKELNVNNEKQNESHNIILLDNNEEILDTKIMEEKIKKREITNYYELSTNSNDILINKYEIINITLPDKYNNFILETNTPIENNKTINLTFLKDGNKDNSITCICLLSSDNKYTIPCKLNTEITKNGEYILANKMVSNEKEIIILSQENINKCKLKLNAKVEETSINKGEKEEPKIEPKIEPEIEPEKEPEKEPEQEKEKGLSIGGIIGIVIGIILAVALIIILIVLLIYKIGKRGMENRYDNASFKNFVSLNKSKDNSSFSRTKSSKKRF